MDLSSLMSNITDNSTASVLNETVAETVAAVVNASASTALTILNATVALTTDSPESTQNITLSELIENSTTEEIVTSATSANTTLTSTIPWILPPRIHEPFISDLPDIIPGQWAVIMTEPVWRTYQVIHTLLTVAALATNCISLIVMYGIVPKLTPPLQLLTSLAFADMLAPWAIMTMYFPASSCQDEIHSALLLTSHNAACFTILALSICHNIATFRPLNYERIMSQKRLWIVINMVWIGAILCAHIHFLAILTHHDKTKPFCLQVLKATDLALTLSFAISAVTLLVAALVYSRILLHLRPMNALAQECEPRKSTRGVVTGILLAVSFFVCWLPYLINKLIQVKEGLWDDRVILIGLAVVQIFILAHSIADPIIYGSRMATMQTGYLGLYHKCRGWAVVTWTRITQTVQNDDLPSTPLNPIESIC